MAGASSVEAVLSGRVGMSPLMVGRAGAFARLTGIVDAAEVTTSEQPAVALVSGEAGIGKTRLVRELIDSLPANIRTIGMIAQPGSMGRPLDAVRRSRRPRASPVTMSPPRCSR